jgi:hypothetical protein
VVTGTLCASVCGVAVATVGPGHDKEAAIRLATVTRPIETCKRPRGPDERFLIATLTSWEGPLIGALDQLNSQKSRDGASGVVGLCRPTSAIQLGEQAVFEVRLWLRREHVHLALLNASAPTTRRDSTGLNMCTKAPLCALPRTWWAAATFESTDVVYEGGGPLAMTG